MHRSGIIAALVALVAVVAGCSSDNSGATVASSSVPPRGIPDCSEVYAEGKEIVAAEFGEACTVDNDTEGVTLVTPVPVDVECRDRRRLMWNDLAWGYLGETMTLFPEDALQRVPSEELRACIDAGDDSATAAADEPG